MCILNFEIDGVFFFWELFIYIVYMYYEIELVVSFVVIKNILM